MIRAKKTKAKISRQIYIKKRQNTEFFLLFLFLFYLKKIKNIHKTNTNKIYSFIIWLNGPFNLHPAQRGRACFVRHRVPLALCWDGFISTFLQPPAELAAASGALDLLFKQNQTRLKRLKAGL